MAAEDYFDFDGFDEPDFSSPRKRPMKKNAYVSPQEFSRVLKEGSSAVIWSTGSGESIKLDEMEEQHLRNTLSYIHRRMEQWNEARTLSKARGQDIGKYFVNGRTGMEWFDLMSAELRRRQLADTEQAVAVLNRTSHLGEVIRVS